MVVNNNYLNNINRISGTQTQPVKRTPVQQKKGFENILQNKMEENFAVKFSKHADMRLKARNISFSSEQRGKIETAVKKAEEKGVKESLVLMDNVALVVNIKSKTVITAVDKNELKENVFTNIDGAVFT